jgi:hypothetical protein
LRLQLIRRTGALGLVAACVLLASKARAGRRRPARSNLTTRASRVTAAMAKARISRPPAPVYETRDGTVPLANVLTEP